MKSRLALMIGCAILCTASVAAAADDALRLVDRHDMPGGYTGDFDHFDYDLKSNRLWLAAEDHGTLDVFDLKTLKMQQSIKGIVATPHGILYVPEKNWLLVTDSGGDMMTRVIDAGSYKVTANLKLAAPGADSLGYDGSRNRLYVVNGGRDAKMQQTYLSVIDPVTLERHGDLKFDTEKVEAMAVESKGNRLYVNVTGRNYVAVVDKVTLAVMATWPIRNAKQNAPAALDEAGKRLFIIARKPATLVVLDTETGNPVASFKAPDHCDQLIWDAANRRIYAIGGEGYIGVFQQRDADHYVELEHVKSAVGAKTGILVPELQRLVVAVSPGEGKTGGALLGYQIVSASN